MDEAPTIFALSSAPGRAGVAVVRVSGPRAGAALDALARAAAEERRAALRKIRDPDDGRGPRRGARPVVRRRQRTETGEDMAEFHLHGGPAIVRGVLAALARSARLPAGASPASSRAAPSRTASIDLAQAEGLADLIEAETEAQRRQAVRQMGGALSALYEGWRGAAARGHGAGRVRHRFLRRGRRCQRRLRARAHHRRQLARGHPRAS